MPGWLQAILIAVAVVVASWLLLIVLARRLPPGVAKDLAGFLPDCVTAVRVLRRDPRVPRRARIAVVVAVLWVLSPIDLIPEFLPVIGPLDDIIVVALLLRYAGRSVPRQVLLEAWPGDPRPDRATARPGPPDHDHGVTVRRSVRFDRGFPEHGEADDPVGDVQRQQHEPVPAAQPAGVDEVRREARHDDQHREVPGQHVVVDEDAAAGEQDDAELGGDAEDDAADDVADADLRRAPRAGSTVRKMSSMVSTRVAIVAPKRVAPIAYSSRMPSVP